MAEKWTNTSSPLSRWMNPKPFPALNHFTVPVSFMFLSSLSLSGVKILTSGLRALRRGNRKCYEVLHRAGSNDVQVISKTPTIVPQWLAAIGSINVGQVGNLQRIGNLI